MNLLDLRSIMGCPRGIRSVFSALSRQKENFTVYFSGIRRSLLHPNTAERSFFSHYNLFLKEKLARKARVITDREYRIVLMPRRPPIDNTPKI